MIKITLKRRKESNTHLAVDRRHRRSKQIAMKVDKVCSFHRDLHTPAVSSVSNRLGVALFPSF